MTEIQAKRHRHSNSKRKNDSLYRRYGELLFHFELEWRCLLACISVIHGRFLVIFSIIRIFLVYSISLILQIFSQCHCEKYYSSSLVGSGHFYNFVAAS